MIKTDSPTFLDKLSEHFANIGANMARNVPKSSNCFKVFSQSNKESFVLQEISEEDVNSSIHKIKIALSKGTDETPPEFVKLSKCALSFISKAI